MDEDISRWVLEFILRSSMDDHLLKRILAVIPIPDKDYRLKKTVLLRAIESETSEAEITEKLLDIFEMIEQLDKTEGVAIIESMKAAYCAVAVECTVKFLVVGGIGKRGKYFDAVRRIWRGKVTELVRSGKSELVSRELKGWMDEVEAAFRDKNVRKKLANMNSRNDALRLVREYMGEEWAILGPPFLQLSASLIDRRMTNEMPDSLIDKTAIASEDLGGSCGIQVPSQRANYARSERHESVQVLSEADTNRSNMLNISRDLGVDDGSRQLAIVAVNTEEVQELATKEAAHTKAQESVEGVVLQDPSPSLSENLKVSVMPRRKSLATHRRVRGGAKISNPDNLENVTSSDKDSCLHSPEVNKVQEALKTSSLELQAMVKDPLPHALRVSEAIVYDLAEKNKNHEHSLGNRNDVGATSPSTNKSDEPLQSGKADFENPCHGHKIIAPQPSLMERNSSARTYEWNDSIDGSPEGHHVGRLHLHSPKRKVISPLKKYEETKFSRRRKSKRWSLLEEDTLRTAVQRFGKGNWKLILNSYRDIFDERTEVDLKDKWRNMTRY